MDATDDEKTVFCGNLSDRMTEEMLFELFLQAAPLSRVSIPVREGGKQATFGFVTFKHLVSVEYAIQLLDGTHIFGKAMNVKRRNSNTSHYNQQQQVPSFTGNYDRMNLMPRHNSGTNQPPHPNNDTFNPNMFNELMQMGRDMLGGLPNPYSRGFERGQRFSPPPRQDHERGDRDRHHNRRRDEFRPYDRHGNYPNSRNDDYRGTQSYYQRNRGNRRR